LINIGQKRETNFKSAITPLATILCCLHVLLS